MDTNELKRLLDEDCAELARILDDCRGGSAENVRVVEVMEPMLQAFKELQEQVFCDVDQSEDQSDIGQNSLTPP